MNYINQCTSLPEIYLGKVAAMVKHGLGGYTMMIASCQAAEFSEAVTVEWTWLFAKPM